MADGPDLPTSPPASRSRGHPDARLLARPRTLWSFTVLAMVLDVALTWLGLSLGLAERNWIARQFIREFGLLGAGALLKGFTLLLGYAGWRLLAVFAPDAGWYRNIVPLAVGLPSWAAVGINVATILAIP